MPHNDLDERLNAISRDLELIRQMQLDSIKREERWQKRFSAYCKAVVSAARAERAARLEALQQTQQAVDKFEVDYDQFFGDIEDGEHESNGQ